jgi:tetratricopeptide (TPR) repeat protein
LTIGSSAYHREVPDCRPIQPDEFVTVMSPLLERRDVHATICTIHRMWTMSQVVELLDTDHLDAKKVAALVLSLIGTDSCLDALARQLKHPDRCLSQMAEHAMWSIWVQVGSEPAKCQFARASMAASNRDLDSAISYFTKAIALDPDFAEAYNQRAMIYYLQERFEESLNDCIAATKLMPLHFGAFAGAGHCHACLGNTAAAIAFYERAKAINPHLECVDDLIRELREAEMEA